MPNAKPKVLIVEDESDIRVLYAEMLQGAGYDVDQAPNGDIGIEKIRSTAFDIILLDIMLPGRDGLRILRELRDTKAPNEAPIIILTNLNSEHIIHEAFNLGADGYLIKSEVTPDKVITEVQKFLDTQAPKDNQMPQGDF